MKTLFTYNWMVREDWYKWCEDVPLEELLKVRTGGVGGILHTLFHIIDVEWSWIRVLKGKPDFQESFDGYKSLEKVKELDELFKKEVQEFVGSWESGLENKLLQETRQDGSIETLTWGEVMRHTIAHEIHHVGQLSVWFREIGKQPVSANLIGKGLTILEELKK
ncbi:DinB family protein [Paenisporosarcina sp. OV554]|uniref:DinB family protein n=1 Tax=Paenisporosarcina sp. OV554 TaxID=2135694 RepID=UPI000D3BD10A|nr:DinB family protein [Paenisporosarcina sp. OV554]PUB14636.1 putative damage-inducible protein DinB [Paenisporosarcina sp. OV554]